MARAVSELRGIECWLELKVLPEQGSVTPLGVKSFVTFF